MLNRYIFHTWRPGCKEAEKPNAKHVMQSLKYDIDNWQNTTYLHVGKVVHTISYY